MYQIKNDSEIYIYDEIMTGLTARQVMSRIQESEGSLAVHINSYGGDVFEALALYNVLKPRGVNVYVDGICASAASIVAMAGKVYMPKNAMMMIHNPVGSVSGSSQEMQDMAVLLDKIRDSIAGIYAAKTKLEQPEIIAMMDAETWMDGLEAKSKGFADELSGAVMNFSRKTYEDGVRDERQRLSDLDSINSRGREAVINRAKYETFQSVSDIALELLRAEDRASDSVKVSAGHAGSLDIGQDMAGIINHMRGWK